MLHAFILISGLQSAIEETPPENVDDESLFHAVMLDQWEDKIIWNDHEKPKEEEHTDE